MSFVLFKIHRTQIYFTTQGQKNIQMVAALVEKEKT